MASQQSAQPSACWADMAGGQKSGRLRRGRPESQARVWEPRAHVSVRLTNGLTSGPITSLTLRLVVWEMAMSPGPTSRFPWGRNEMMMWAQPLPWTPAASTYFREGFRPRSCPESITQEAGEGQDVAME